MLGKGSGAVVASFVSTWDDKGVAAAKRDIDKFEAQTNQSTSSFGKWGAAAAVAGAAVAAFAVKLGVDAVQAAMAEEAEVARLNQTLGNLGFGDAADQVGQFIDNLQYTTTFTDSQMRPAFAKLAVATKDVAKAQAAMATTLDLATYKGVDAEVAAQALAKAFSGNTKALKTMVPGLDATILKSGDMNAIMAELSRVVGGQASAAANTLSGKLKILSNAGSELQEAFGKGIMEGFFDAVSGGSDDLQVATDALRKNQATVEAWGKAIGNIIGSAIGWLDDFGLGAMKVADTYADALALMDRANINTLDTLGLLSDQEAQLKRDALDAADAGREQAMRNYALKASTQAATTATVGLTGATGDTAAAAVDAKAAADELKGAIDGLLGGLSRYETVHAFKKSLHDLEDTLKGNARSFKGWSDAAEENRTTLIDAFQSAQGVVGEWAKRTGASADEVAGKFATLGVQIVDRFVKQGFKKSDIKAFLKDAGLWSSTLRDALNGMDVTSDAYRLGKATATAMGDGFVQGLQISARAMANQASTSITIANQAAKNAAGIASPSKVWAEMGGNLADGLVQGLKSKDQSIKDAATSTANAVMDKAGEILGKWDDKLAVLKDGLDRAVALFDEFKASTSSAILDAFDFKSIAPQVDENGQMVGGTFMDGLRSQAALAMKFAEQVKTLISQGLSREALSMVLQAGAAAGSNIATDLINGGATAIAETNELVAAAQGAADEVGTLAATSFYGAGVAQAQSTYEGFKANFGPGGPARVALEKLMDRLANSLDRTATITVRTVYEAAGIAGKRAAGGPVSSGAPYLVGEVGPELFVPSTSGTIIPNNRLGGASSGSGGNSYTINVSTGVGDPRQIGQSIVEYVRRFEQSNGSVWVAA